MGKNGGILDDKITIKRGRTPQGYYPRQSQSNKDLQTAFHNSNGYRQSLFFVSSFGKSKQNSIAFVLYMSQDDTLVIKQRDGSGISLGDAKKEVSGWVDDTKKRKGPNRFTMHLVLQSLPGGDVKKAEKGFQLFLNKEFPNNEFLYAIHTDKESPHAHVSIKMQGKDRKKIKAQKPDLLKWRESLAEEMRSQGFKVAATSRQSRGLVGRALQMGSKIKFEMHNKILSASNERKYDKENINQWKDKYQKISVSLKNSNDPKLKKMGDKIFEFSQSFEKSNLKETQK